MPRAAVRLSELEGAMAREEQDGVPGYLGRVTATDSAATGMSATGMRS
jgi:hypothetical protein